MITTIVQFSLPKPFSLEEAARCVSARATNFGPPGVGSRLGFESCARGPVHDIAIGRRLFT